MIYEEPTSLISGSSSNINRRWADMVEEEEDKEEDEEEDKEEDKEEDEEED
jgi:hypothetical protein